MEENESYKLAVDKEKEDGIGKRNTFVISLKNTLKYLMGIMFVQWFMWKYFLSKYINKDSREFIIISFILLLYYEIFWVIRLRKYYYSDESCELTGSFLFGIIVSFFVVGVIYLIKVCY